MEFGKMMEECRKFLNIRQEDLAEMCEISMKSIQKIENDKANPTWNTMSKILTILGMELSIQIKKQ